jgi:hypothetical protein
MLSCSFFKPNFFLLSMRPRRIVPSNSLFVDASATDYSFEGTGDFVVELLQGSKAKVASLRVLSAADTQSPVWRPAAEEARRRGLFVCKL